MAKYNVGDKVKIRHDLRGNKRYEGLFCNSDMKRLRGKEMTIGRVLYATNRQHDEYQLREDVMGWLWCDAMFEDDAPDPVSLDVSSIL